MRFRFMLSSMSAAAAACSAFRRHEMIFFNISKTIRDSDFKIYHKVVLDSLFIRTGNDVINYFRSAANRTNVIKFWVIFESRFLDNGSTDSEKVYSLETAIQVVHFLLCNVLDIFCSLAHKMGLKRAYRRLGITQMADSG